MTAEQLKILGLISTLPPEKAKAVESCINEIQEILKKDQDVGLIAFAFIGAGIKEASS